jgi:hypothetical protein
MVVAIRFLLKSGAKGWVLDGIPFPETFHRFEYFHGRVQKERP